jgi:hypothetical protein
MKTTNWANLDTVNSNSLEKRLLSYGLAASAVLAAGVKADAAVQTFDFSGAPPTSGINGHIYFSLQSGTFSTSSNAGMTFDLRQLSSSNGAVGGTALGIANAGGIVGLPPGYAFKLGPNSQIGASRAFVGTGNLNGKSSFGTGNPGGIWPPNGSVGFLGLRFTANDGVHYGWAEISLNSNYTETLYALGFETTAGTAITTPASVVPEPSELALLAVGATGLAIVRNRRKKKAAGSA